MCYGFKTTTHDQGFHCLNFPYFSSLIVTTQLKNCLKFYSFHKTSYSWLGVSPSSVIYLSWLPIHLLSSLEVTIQLKIASRFKVSTQLLMAWGFTCQFIIIYICPGFLKPGSHNTADKLLNYLQQNTNNPAVYPYWLLRKVCILNQ